VVLPPTRTRILLRVEPMISTDIYLLRESGQRTLFRPSTEAGTADGSSSVR